MFNTFGIPKSTSGPLHFLRLGIAPRRKKQRLKSSPTMRNSAATEKLAENNLLETKILCAPGTILEEGFTARRVVPLCRLEKISATLMALIEYMVHKFDHSLWIPRYGFKIE